MTIKRRNLKLTSVLIANALGRFYTPCLKHLITPSGNMQTNQSPPFQWPDVRIRELIEACQRFTHKSPPWDLLWNSLRGFPWHLWSYRNKRLKKHTLRPLKVLTKVIIRSISLFYKCEDFRNECCSQLERDTSWGYSTSYLITSCKAIRLYKKVSTSQWPISPYLRYFPSFYNENH